VELPFPKLKKEPSS